jgi:hypothetical protein
MNTIELFAGTGSFSKVAEKLGHTTFKIDNDPSFEPDLCVDILELPIEQFKKCRYDMLWASPPCTAFSVASISRHWQGNKKGITPKSKEAMLGLQLLEKTIEWISILRPAEWYIENPRAAMRKVIDDLFKKYGIMEYKRVTVTYCQYGDTRMKPTDIWTNNLSWISRPPCKNGAKCHDAAPRGSKTGTQGLKNAKERGVIPEALFIEIFGGHDEQTRNSR